MDFRSLQLFQHLATSLHFGKTSQAMFVSPSTLSRAIQRLEDESGATLFIRNNRSVKMTDAGEKMLTFSQQVLADWLALKQELDSANRLLSGELSLYCSVTASQSHLPQLLSRFRTLHPNVEIKLVTGDHVVAVQKVIAKDADVALAIHTPNFPQELCFRPLGIVPLDLIVPKETQITNLNQVDWRQTQVILPESGPSKRIVHHWFAEHGIRPRIYASVAGNEAIVSMVALGFGVGFVPRIVLENSTFANQVNSIQVADIEPYHLGICCLTLRQTEPAIAAFLQSHTG